MLHSCCLDVPQSAESKWYTLCLKSCSTPSMPEYSLWNVISWKNWARTQPAQVPPHCVAVLSNITLWTINHWTCRYPLQITLGFFKKNIKGENWGIQNCTLASLISITLACKHSCMHSQGNMTKQTFMTSSHVVTISKFRDSMGCLMRGSHTLWWGRHQAWVLRILSVLNKCLRLASKSTFLAQYRMVLNISPVGTANCIPRYVGIACPFAIVQHRLRGLRVHGLKRYCCSGCTHEWNHNPIIVIFIFQN